MISLLLAYRMQEYVGIKPAEPLPPCMSLAWHPVTSQVAIASSHSHVHVCNAGAAPPRKQKQDAADLQSELLLWHEVQQQVQSATCLPWLLQHTSTVMTAFNPTQKSYSVLHLLLAWSGVEVLQAWRCVCMAHLPSRHRAEGCA